MSTIKYFLCALCAVTLGAQAEDKKEEYQWGVGLGVGAFSHPYDGQETDIVPFPYISYQSDVFYVAGTGLGVIVAGGDNWWIDIIAEARFAGYDEDDSSALRGMDDRDMSIDAGIGINFWGDWGYTSLKFLTDTLFIHEGQELRWNYNLPIPVGDFTIEPYVGASWFTQNFVDYYYGVENVEVAVGRPAYEPDDAIVPFTGLSIAYSITPRWQTLLNVQVDYLDDEISDSPIVDKDYTTSAILGVVYKF